VGRLRVSIRHLPLYFLIGAGVLAVAWTDRYQPMGMAGSRGIVVWDRWGARSCSMPTRGRKSCGVAWWNDPLGIEARRAQRERLAQQAEALRQAELRRREECERVLASPPPTERPTDVLGELLASGERAACERLLGR
jgi:hypothetical protein